jgi:hypothetical protein
MTIQTDQSEATHHYRPPAPAAHDSADGTARVIAPGPTPTQALPPAPTKRQPSCLLAPPHHPERAVAPGALAVALLGQALSPPMEPDQEVWLGHDTH